MYYHHPHQVFVIATISFVLKVAGDLPDLQAPPQLCSINNKTIVTTQNLIIIINNNNKNKFNTK